jgi:DNA-binding LacI/PurR family transcriptional regulator
MTATIKKIAKIAGVGVGTVSRVLNNQPHVRDSVRKKILKIVRELNYHPNQAARMLVKGTYQQTTIGLVLPFITHRFFFEVVEGIYHTLLEFKYNLLIFNTGQSREVVIEHISEGNLAGLIFLGDPPLTESELELIQAQNTPFIYLDHYQEDVNCIFFDNFAGGKLAARYLIEKNRRNILFLGGINHTQQQNDRYSSFKDEISKSSDIRFRERYIPVDEEEAYNCLIEEIKEKGVDGVFCFADIMAFGGIKAKKELKSDTCIIGYDDIRSAQYVNLSTIRQPAWEIGQLGAESIVKLIDEQKSKTGFERINIKLKPELIDRGS